MRRFDAASGPPSQNFEFYAGVADKLYGHTIPMGQGPLNYIGKAHGLAARIKAGQIYINNFFGGGVAAPFGGYKKSGFGREKGLEALAHYTQVKNVYVAID
jgi:hypothetical protein